MNETEKGLARRARNFTYAISIRNLYADAIKQLETLRYFVIQTSIENIGTENKIIVQFPGMSKYVSFETKSEFLRITKFKYSQENVLNWIKLCVDKEIEQNNEGREYYQRRAPETYFLKYEKIDSIQARSFTYLCYDTEKIEINYIIDVPSFLKENFDYCSEILDAKVYFRGQLANWQMIPSLFREKEWVKKEAELNAMILSNRPNDFLHCNSYFEKLVVLKHYNQPSRLLDITSNSLIALYFACRYMKNDTTGIGAVNCVFGGNTETDKYAIMSDTVNMLTALAYTKNKCSECSSYSCLSEDDGECEFLNELKYQLHLQYGNSLWNDLNVKKLDTCILVHPPLNNQRIVRQQGLFLMCGRNSRKWIDGSFDSDGNFEPDCGEERQFEAPDSLYSFLIHGEKQRCYIIKRSVYEKILTQLSMLGIDDYFIFGELENAIDITKSEILKPRKKSFF